LIDDCPTRVGWEGYATLALEAALSRQRRAHGLRHTSKQAGVFDRKVAAIPFDEVREAALVVRVPELSKAPGSDVAPSTSGRHGIVWPQMVENVDTEADDRAPFGGRGNASVLADSTSPITPPPRGGGSGPLCHAPRSLHSLRTVARDTIPGLLFT
jgi:hypothetical protein